MGGQWKPPFKLLDTSWTMAQSYCVEILQVAQSLFDKDSNVYNSNTLQARTDNSKRLLDNHWENEIADLQCQLIVSPSRRFSDEKVTYPPNYLVARQS